MTISHHSINVTVLDGYQGVALRIADWSKVSSRPNIAAFWPVAAISFNFRRRASSDAGIGVRSRMAKTTSNGAKRSATATSSAG